MSISADIVKAAKALKADIVKIANAAPKVLAKIDSEAPEVESLVALAFPQAAPFEAAGLAILDAIEAAVVKSGNAATANGLDVVQDKGVISAVEAVVALVKKV